MAKKIRKTGSSRNTNPNLSGMNRSLGNLSPKRILMVLTVLAVIALATTGCEKQHECPDGYNHDIRKNPPMFMPAKSSDQCEFERNERDTAEYRLIYVYDPDVRNAIGPATNGPDGDISNLFWGNFCDYFPQPYDPSNFTIRDTVNGARYAIRAIWKDYGNPFPYNGAEIQTLYDFCGIDSIGYDDLQTKQGALDDCENSVGIDEYEWVNDPCGGYWTTKGNGR